MVSPRQPVDVGGQMAERVAFVPRRRDERRDKHRNVVRSPLRDELPGILSAGELAHDLIGLAQLFQFEGVWRLLLGHANSMGELRYRPVRMRDLCRGDYFDITAPASTSDMPLTPKMPRSALAHRFVMYPAGQRSVLESRVNPDLRFHPARAGGTR